MAAEKISIIGGYYYSTFRLDSTRANAGWMACAGSKCPGHLQGKWGCYTNSAFVAAAKIHNMDDECKLHVKQEMAWSWQRNLYEAQGMVNPFPQSITPYPYQIVGSNHAAAKRRCIIADDMGLGKGLRLNEELPTPNGFVEAKTVKVGDFLIGSNGKPVRVVGVYPQGQQKCYKITFSDCEIVCDENHLWAVNSTTRKARGNGNLTIKTSELVDCLDKFGNSKYYIPMSDPVNYSGKVMPIDPYVLGVILGDGNSSPSGSTSVTDDDSGIWGRISSAYSLGHDNSSNPNCQTRTILGISGEIRELGLNGKNSWEKFIPNIYFQGSVGQRIELLNGLMDTDGYLAKDSRLCQYNTSSKDLADDVRELVCSLGGTVKLSQKIPTYTYLGRKLNGRLHYTLTVSLPKGINPFGHGKHAARYEEISDNMKYGPTRAIRKVEEIEQQETVCFKVDAEDSLFLVTRNYVVTHNTCQAIAAFSINNRKRVLIICPASLRSNWERECNKFQDKLQAYQFEQFPGEGIAILNYDRLKKHETELRAIRWDCVIFDEAHYLKNQYSKRTQIALGNAIMPGIVPDDADLYFLTGTPILKDPGDLWPIIHALDPKEEFYTWEAYSSLYMGYKKGKSRSDGKSKPQNLDVLMVRLRLYHMIRRLKADVLKDLPAKIVKVIKLDEKKRKGRGIALPFDSAEHQGNVTPQERAAIRAAFIQEQILSAEIDVARADNRLDAIASFAAEYEKIKQAQSDLPMAKERVEAGVSKLPLVVERLESFFEEEETEKIIIFACHKVVIAGIKQALEAIGIGYVSITGDTKQKDRDPAVQKFQNDPTCRAFVGNIQAAGVGITLTAATRVFFAEFSWSPKENEQAEDRAYRIGQKGTVFVEYIAADGIDMAVLRVCARKADYARRALDGNMAGNAKDSDMAESQRLLLFFSSNCSILKDDPYTKRICELLTGRPRLNAAHVQLLLSCGAAYKLLG